MDVGGFETGKRELLLMEVIRNLEIEESALRAKINSATNPHSEKNQRRIYRLKEITQRILPEKRILACTW